MKNLLALAATLTLTACAGSGFSPTPQYDQAVVTARNSNPDDVRFCEYEASKAAPAAANRNFLVQAVDDQEARMRVFNACMRYKSGR